MRRPRLLTACAFLGVASATACSAVLGFETLSPLPDDGGTAGDATTNVGDAPADVVASPADTGGSKPDATEDSAPPLSDGGPDSDGSDGGGSDGASPDADADAAACVANLTNDSKHCGRCNHDCLGGACTNGMCAPIRFADVLAFPQGLTVDATYIYVTDFDRNRILRIPKDQPGSCLRDVGSIPSQCVLIDQPNAFRPTAITNDGARLYWVNRSQASIVSCPVSGCGSQAATVLATPPASAFDHPFGPGTRPLDLVVRDGLVFWAETGSGAIRSAQTDGGSPRTYFENASYMPVAIALDDKSVYFTDETNQHPTQIAAVRRDGSNQDGGSVHVVASSPARPYGLALSKNTLYWTVPFVALGDGRILGTPADSDGGAPVKSIATNLVDPYMMIADETNLYWVSPGSDNAATGFVLTCPLTGCPQEGPIVLAKDQRQPRHLSQDEGAIYWSNEGLETSALYDGQVWKIAKP